MSDGHRACEQSNHVCQTATLIGRYFLTWTTYGTWLHGDKRGWADRKEGYHRGGRAHDPLLRQRRERQLKHPATLLTPEMRNCVEAAICEVCAYRDWTPREINVRSNHVHAVLFADKPIDAVLRDFKTYATRALRAAGLVGPEHDVWTDGGGKVVLRDDEAVERCCEYVRNQ